ncbi:Putative beta-glucuronidase (Glycosyl hydrolase 2 family protein P8) (P8_GH2) (Polysaccharide utilization locus H protein P8) (PUL H protein P8) [Durusdinium trenchii]|uniref:Beta-glucuronidase (Glycosyl hydrolase 2 family protein P8) (P8_GH2) (Polysaccharide utilization locus H protein P8) (PUL H protein P8) n=1 Tax=Durusdinium trenchii TaxID=1381693 RepID=A0ABP0IUA0_9DINO
MRGAALPFFTLLASASPAERPPYPHYPGRRVVTLEGRRGRKDRAGPWDFAYLGDVPLAAGAFIREEEFQGTRLVPDAFNDREWLCPLQQCPQWPTHPCHRCCHALRTGSAEPSCDRALPQCCDPVGLGRRGVAAYRIYLEPEARMDGHPWMGRRSEVSLLHFRGCGLRCAVLLDRTSVAEPPGRSGWTEEGLPWPSGPRAPRAARSSWSEIGVRDGIGDGIGGVGTLQRLHFDWLQPGGILRPVEAGWALFSITSDHFTSPTPTPGTLLARLHFSGLETPRERRLDCLGATSTPTAPSARVAQSAAWLETLGPGAGVWTSERPELQMLMVQLMLDGRQVDAITVRFGLRWLEAKEQQLWLNGAPLQLRGVNRHESWVWGGLHRPWAELQEDIQLLLELNANFVRGAHYSQDQRFLDLCDENGILETSAWQPSSEDLADPAAWRWVVQLGGAVPSVKGLIERRGHSRSVRFDFLGVRHAPAGQAVCPVAVAGTEWPVIHGVNGQVFMALQAQALRETIEASANHPSAPWPRTGSQRDSWGVSEWGADAPPPPGSESMAIVDVFCTIFGGSLSIRIPSIVIIFGFLNEADASEPTVARPAFARLAQLARQMGQGRLVAWASRHKIRDVTLDLGDLIAFNDYPGWYDASVLEIPSVWESYADWARATHPGKPLLIAEAGAGGLAGWHGRPGEEAWEVGLGDQDLWSEELQASIVGATLSAALAAGYIGVALWQFADVRVDGALYWSERPTAEEEEGLPEVLVNVSSGAEWMERVAVVYQSINNLFGQHRPLRPRELNNKGLLSLSRRELGHTERGPTRVHASFHLSPRGDEEATRSRQHKKLAFYAAQAGGAHVVELRSVPVPRGRTAGVTPPFCGLLKV